MKIGLVIYGSLDTLSGGYLYDRMLVDYLHAQGDTVEIVSLPWRNYAAHLTDNFRFRLPQYLDKPPVNSYITNNPSLRAFFAKQSPRTTRRLLRREKRPPRNDGDTGDFDILIQDELNHPSLIAANAGKHPYPIISLVHHLRCSELRSEWQNKFYRIIEKRYLQSVDGFIFNSETTKTVVNRVIESSKPSVVAFPPTDRFGEAISESEIIERAKSEEFRILFLGNLIERKGLHTLIDGLGQIGNLSYRLDVVGSLTADPAYSQSIQKNIAANHLSSFILLHNSLNNEPLKQLLEQAHILIVPSSYEGFGIVYLEGMGFGLPAIGTTAGAAGEIIEDGKTGYLIEPGDSKTLASRLAGLWADRGLLTRLSLEARRRYLRQPKWEQTAGQIREFLQKQIGTFSV